MNEYCDCELLDAYLADDLPSEAADRFLIHLADCSPCRSAVAQQHWIDGLLSAASRAEFESPPRMILESLRESLARRRQQRKLLGWGLTAAAMLLVAVGWTARLSRQAMPTAESDKGTIPLASNASSPEQPRATFVGGPDVIIVPVEFRHPDVTVVRVYRTYQPDYTDQSSNDQFPTEELECSEFSNGG